MAEQIAVLLAAFTSPLFLLLVNRRRRHDEMNMRVKAQPAGVRMQHGDGAGRAAQLPVVAAEGAHGFPTAPHDEIVNDVRLRPGQRPELGWQGKRDQKIVGRYELAQLTFQPLLTFMMLTMGAVAMTAGMRRQ